MCTGERGPTAAHAGSTYVGVQVHKGWQHHLASQVQFREQGPVILLGMTIHARVPAGCNALDAAVPHGQIHQGKAVDTDIPAPAVHAGQAAHRHACSAQAIRARGVRQAHNPVLHGGRPRHGSGPQPAPRPSANAGAGSGNSSRGAFLGVKPSTDMQHTMNIQPT